MLGLVGPPTTEAYVKFLCFLLDRITVQDDDPDDDGGRRRVKLRWEADPLWLETLEPLSQVLPEDQPRRVAACVEINQCVGVRSSGEDRHRHAIEQASRRWRGGRRAVKF